MSESPTHLHCRNYAPIDVVKGVCHVTKMEVNADDEACPSFDRLPRCMECKLYSATEEKYVGVCGATSDKPMTYPNLAAVTCEWFEWRKD